MEAWAQELGDYRGAGRLRGGWRLARAAWRLIRGERSLLVLALVAGGLGAALGAGSFLMASWLGPGARGGDLWFLHLAGVAVYTLCTTYVFAALACAVDAAVDSTPIGPLQALREAGDHLGPVLGWGVASSAAWIALQIAAASDLPGLVVPLASLVWALATVFVLPALILTTDFLGEAIEGSARAIGGRWRELFAGLFRVGAFTLLAVLVVGLLFGIGSRQHRDDHVFGLPLFVVGLGLSFAILALGSATKQAFALLLYRDALGELPVPADTPQEPRRKPWKVVGRTVAIIAIGLIALTLRSDARDRADGKPRTSAEGYFWVAYSASADRVIDEGTPIHFRGRQIGHVVDHWIESPNVRVVYYLEPGKRGLPDRAELILELPQPGQAVLRFARVRSP